MNGDSVCLDETSYVKFSVWVSFCEIYNESIYDLLDHVSNGSHRRSVLRLAQDVKGNTFVKGNQISQKTKGAFTLDSFSVARAPQNACADYSTS